MGEVAYEVIASNLTDTSQAPKGRDVYYRCTRCTDVVASQPRDNIGCRCGNVFVDVDSFRLAVRDLSAFEAVRLLT
jgi:hypothetical protein